MTIQPTLQLSFSPNCRSFSCCVGGDHYMYPTKSGKMKSMTYLSDKEIAKSNERFREIIESKLESLPINVQDFIDRLQHEEGISLQVTRENPLTKERLEETTDAINQILRNLHI